MFDAVLKTVTTTKPISALGTTTASDADIFNWFAGASVALIILAIFAIIIGLACLIIIIVSNCKIFKKAGEDWWKAIIPFYNTWVETRIAGLNWYWFPIYIVLFGLSFGMKNPGFTVSWAFFLVSFNYVYGMCKRFGKSNGFAVLVALLPVVGLPILAFGNAKYDANAKLDPNGIFALKK